MKLNPVSFAGAVFSAIGIVTYVACAQTASVPQSLAPDSKVQVYQRGLHDFHKSRIAAGSFAAKGYIPWQAAIVSAGWLPKDSTFCGGAVIGAHWILTAGHCIAPGATAGSQYVFIGPVDLRDVGQKLKIDRFYFPNGFDRNTLDRDLALLFVEQSVDATMAKPIQILSLNDEPGAEQPPNTGRVSGWGQTGETAPKSELLKYVNVEFQDHTICAQNYKKQKKKNLVVTNNMVCAGSNQSDQGDACFGDSGGPLIVPFGDDFRLAGTVSWGEGCSRAGLYGVYTRDPNFKSWVGEYVKVFESNPDWTKLPPSSPNPYTPSGIVRTRRATEEAVQPEWQIHIDWSAKDTGTFGETNCPEQYPFPGCVISGGRSCLIRGAIQQARSDRCEAALSTTLVTQCHNPEAQKIITAAGPAKVCTYLKSFPGN